MPRTSRPRASRAAGADPGPARTTRAWVVLTLIGAVGGLLSGAFGVGGGIIMVPLLLAFAGMDQRRAATTSLAAIIPTAVAGGAAYLVRREIDVPVALGLVGTGLVMGVASGLFGIGGGVFLVPVLISVFGAGDLAAKGTSLLVVLATALVGTLTNLRGGMVDLRVGAVVGLAATLTSFGGVALASALPPRLSGVLFAGLLLFSAVQITVRAVRTRKTA